MPRQVDQDVHSAFVEFRGGADDKCMSVQCIYCQKVRAKNTTRQKQHLLNCANYLQAHPEVAAQSAAVADNEAATATAAVVAPNATPIVDSFMAQATDGQPHSGDHTTLGFMPNPRFNGADGTPSQGRPSTGPDGTPAAKRQKTTKTATPGSAVASSEHLIPLKEVHAAYQEFRAKEDDKCMSAKCLYCNQVRAKNTSRQREHLMTCPGYQSILKERLPANTLRHQFDDDDVARSLTLPTPELHLEFRLSIRVKPKISVGAANFGYPSWVTCTGGQWAGTWGKGVVLPGGQDLQITVKNMATRIDARYLIQTNDENPAVITCTIKGWWTGDTEIMERLQDPVAADNVSASRYKMRVTMELETGDERYAHINTGMWVGSGCRRGVEIVYDAYRIN